MVRVGRGDRRAFEEMGRAGVRQQQPFQALAALRVVAAGFGQERGPFGRVRLFQGGREDRFVGHGVSP